MRRLFALALVGLSVTIALVVLSQRSQERHPDFLPDGYTWEDYEQALERSGCGGGEIKIRERDGELVVLCRWKGRIGYPKHPPRDS